jgi:hypothetical protein
MTGPVGFSRSNKGLESGWALEPDQEQFHERLRQNLLQLDGAVHHQFGFNPNASYDLVYAYFGGMIDDGASWLHVPDGTLTLPNNATSYVERDPGTGAVTSNITGFTYPSMVPMAEVTTKFNRISDVIDRRPHDVSGGGGGGGGGCVTFPCLVGVILNSQVPVGAVTQHQSALSLSFSQLFDTIADGQVPQSAVTQHESALTLSFTQLYDQIADSQVPESAVLQWLPDIAGASLPEILGWMMAHVADETHRHVFNVALYR